MKKFLKFVGGVVSMAAVAFGAYCVYKNVIAKKEEDGFDDFDDCFEDEGADDADREYVSINITADEETTAENADEEAKEEGDAKEEDAKEENAKEEDAKEEEAEAPANEAKE